MEKDMIITISDEAFISMREAVDQQLCTTLKMMKIREADKVTISLDIKIRLSDVKTTDLKTGEIQIFLHDGYIVEREEA